MLVPSRTVTTTGALTVCVFAGSAPVVPDDHRALATQLGRTLASAGAVVVTGGGSTGSMGAVADAALGAGARVIGVVPRGLFTREEVHHAIELIEVESLHERKQVMLGLADAFVALPGGFGTLDELSEVLTWAQLGIHAKPTVLLDPDDFWAGVVAWIDGAVAAGYVPAASRAFLARAATDREVLPTITAFTSPPTRRDLTPEQA